jgi:hypothetical protein
MPAQTLNRLCGRMALVLSLIALLTVLSGYTQPRDPAPTDEGAGAHIFQIAIVLLAATFMVFLLTADWKRPGSVARRLAVPAAAVVAAFTALYILEHVYFR